MSVVSTSAIKDIATKRAIEALDKKLGHVNFYNFLASRLIATDADQKLASVTDLTAWIDGIANQIIVTNNGDGTITLSTPQDIHLDATPEFAGITIRNGSDYVVFHVDTDEMYFTVGDVPIATGMPMGLLLTLTYNV